MRQTVLRLQWTMMIGVLRGTTVREINKKTQNAMPPMPIKVAMTRMKEQMHGDGAMMVLRNPSRRQHQHLRFQKQLRMMTGMIGVLGVMMQLSNLLHSLQHNSSSSNKSTRPGLVR